MRSICLQNNSEGFAIALLDFYRTNNDSPIIVKFSLSPAISLQKKEISTKISTKLTMICSNFLYKKYHITKNKMCASCRTRVANYKIKKVVQTFGLISFAKDTHYYFLLSLSLSCYSKLHTL